MKRIFFLIVLSLIIKFSVRAQSTGSLAYTGYHVLFVDDFTEYGGPTDFFPSLTFLSNPIFNSRWTTSLGDFGGRNEYLHPDALIMPQYSIMRITESDITPFNICDGSGGWVKNYHDYSCTCPGRHVSKLSGILNTIDKFSYGIIEVSAKFPDPSVWGESVAAETAFWTDGGEIDIFDMSTAHTYQVALIDWKTLDGKGGKVYRYGVSQDLSNGYHKFSCVYTPSSATFYLDDIFQKRISYNENGNRMYPERNRLQLVLFAKDATPSGQYLDIDWVRVWKKDCADEELEIKLPDYVHMSTYLDPLTVIPYVKPDLHKAEKVKTSGYLNTVSDKATIFEGGSVTINQTFIANESTIIPKISKIGEDKHDTVIIGNGFFLAQPIYCNHDDNNVTDNNGKWFKTPEPQSYLPKNTMINDVPEIEVFPNPAHNIVSLSYLSFESGAMNLIVKDISGKEVLNETIDLIKGCRMDHKINIESYIPGVYFVELKTTGYSTVKKLVKL